MSINSVSKRSSGVAQEDLKAKPPLTGSFDSLAPPRGNESMLEVCAENYRKPFYRLSKLSNQNRH